MRTPYALRQPGHAAAGPAANLLAGAQAGGAQPGGKFGYPPSGGMSGGQDRERGHAVHSAIRKAIQRLEDLIDEETAALRERKAIDLREFNNRKSQALYELTRSSRLVEDVTRDPETMARLKVLRGKLDFNQKVLKMHMEAVGEIITIMTEAIHEAESDGTYSLAIRNAGKKP